MAFSPETYALCLKNTAEKIDEALTSVYNYKGSVDTIADLPLTNNKVGDTYDVKSEGGQNYGWNGESWDSLGVNREATDTDLGLIKKKDNTFNTTTFVGDMTAINSDNTSITGSGITSVNGEGNFEVSKPTTILASKTNNIAGEVVTISPSSSINLTTARINLVTTGPAREGITINANDMPLTLQGKIVIDGSDTTYINTPVETNDLVDVSALTVRNNASIYSGNFQTLDVSKNAYFLNIGYKDAERNPFLYETGTDGVMILGYDNTLIYTYNSTVTESIIIGNNNGIKNTAENIFVIGKSNYINGSNSIVSGAINSTFDNYCLVSGTYNNAYALGQVIFGSHHNSTSASYDMRNAEYSLISGVSNFANGKTASVLGDNLLGSRETGSLTIGTFNEKKDAMFVIGGGNQLSSGVIARKNILEVYNDGTFCIGCKNNINGESAVYCLLGYGLESPDSVGGKDDEKIAGVSQIITGVFNKIPSTASTDIFTVGNGISSTSRSNAMRLTRGGTLYYQSAVSGGADYAEFYEWSDGNPNDEDRIGCFVTFDFDKEYNYISSRQLPHIKVAQPGDYILGVISGNPALIGNGDEEWRERWLYDDFDRPIVKTIEVPIMELQEVETGEYKTEIQYDENDNEIEVQVPIIETKEVDTGKTELKYVQVLNPDYDENKTYKSRIDRPEWEPIGMLGNLSIKDDGTCIPGEFCKCGIDGIATHADKRDFDTYLVTRRVDDNVVKIVFK